MKNLFQRWVLARLWATFIVMGLSFFMFVAGTVDLGLLFMANAAFIANNGWMAVMDGGLVQLAGLAAKSYLSMMAYVVFKACEYRLVHWLGEAH